ncbi:MAG: purine-nucleoside phosphorylase [Clostridia bacterium]|nr:purine-nucleoside phosphorylase [Clostridia bacterium]
MTPHISSKKDDIAKIVLCPGDPLRAKYIAENFLENARLVNSVRNMLAYTGTYKGKEITVFSSGMGMPSMGIYCYELYKFYDVDTIIRIGSCGAYDKTLNIFDTILVEKSYTEGNFAKALNNADCHIIEADASLNNLIKETASEKNIKCIPTNVLCSECFDYYIENLNILLNRLPKDVNITAAEMESFALFYTAKYLNKKASCLLTVVDSHCKNQKISADEREKSLNDMITLALESALKI